MKRILRRWKRKFFRSIRASNHRWKRRFHPSVGSIGEITALRFLLDRDYDVVARNFHIGSGELDIIAYDREALVFIEVKARGQQDDFPPQLAVTARKEEQIVRLANAFCHRYGLDAAPIRFDVVAVTILKGPAPKVEHFISAF